MHLQFTRCKIQEAHSNNARFDDDQCKELPIHSGFQGKQVMTWFMIDSPKIYSSQGVKFRKHITTMHSLMMTNAQYLQFGQSFSVKQFWISSWSTHYKFQFSRCDIQIARTTMWSDDRCHHIIIKKKHLFKQQIQEQEQLVLPVTSSFISRTVVWITVQPKKVPETSIHLPLPALPEDRGCQMRSEWGWVQRLIR
jgi:hypothetical protein